MSFSASVPVANIAAANTALQGAGWGPNNFSVPVWTSGAMPSAAVLYHIANDSAFQAACVALPNVTVRTYPTLTVSMDATAAAIGGRWGNNAPLLQGSVPPGLYQDGSALWWVIQAFDRSVFKLAPETYPALLRLARVPGKETPWVQPIDAFDAYKLVNPITGQPDHGPARQGDAFRTDLVRDARRQRWQQHLATVGFWMDKVCYLINMLQAL